MANRMPSNRARMPLDFSQHGKTYRSVARELGVSVGDVANTLNGMRSKVGRDRRGRILGYLQSIGIIKPCRARTRITVGNSGCAK
jgi:hypothetical protein